MAKLAGTDIVVPIKGGILKGLMESRGEVSGTIGSHENGTPNVKTDVVFYVDTATMSIDEANDRIDAYAAELAKRGLDVQITVRDVVSADGFAAAVEGTAGDLRKDSNRYAFFLTNGTLSADQLDELGSRLAELGMDASAITDMPADWAEFAEKFDGKAYSFSDFSADTDDAAFVSLINGMAYDTDMDVSTNNSLIGDSLNIISDIKKGSMRLSTRCSGNQLPAQKRHEHKGSARVRRRYLRGHKPGQAA